MTREEVIKNLGTIAKSGTERFGKCWKASNLPAMILS